MLSMSVITHINALTNIPTFLTKGLIVGVCQFFGILGTLIFSGILFSSHITFGFPSKPGSDAILPTACFESQNPDLTSDLNSGAQEIKTKHLGDFAQFLILAVFFLLAVLVMVLYSLKRCCCGNPQRLYVGRPCYCKLSLRSLVL